MEPIRREADATSGAGAAPATPAVRQHAERLLSAVGPVVGVASNVAGYVLGIALLSMLSAVVLVLVLVRAVEPASAVSVVLLGLSGLVLFLPGLVLGVFWIGLRQLISIPGEVSRFVGALGERGEKMLAAQGGGAPPGGRLRRFVGLLRSLVDVRASLLQSRDVFARGLVLLRVANPVSLVVVLAATVAAVLITVIGAIVSLGVVL